MSEELKACPFCGGEPKLRGRKVCCTTCGAHREPGEFSEAEAIAAWNRRTPSEPVSREAEPERLLIGYASRPSLGTLKTPWLQDDELPIYTTPAPNRLPVFALRTPETVTPLSQQETK